MFSLFKSKPKPRSLWDRFMDFKVAIGSLMAICIAFGYFYGYVKPDYSNFKDNTEIVAALYPNGALQIVMNVNQIPNIPVTVLITDGTHQLVHRHYDEGIGTLFGSNCTTGACIVEEITQLSFQPRNGHLSIKFVFNSWQTLFKNDFTIWKVPIQFLNAEGQVEEGKNEDNTFVNGPNGVWV